jgi:2-oxoglutarate dehydrogenase E1 component
MSSSKNLEYKKTSFLSKSNSAFIEQMYVGYINKDPNLPESWKNYFNEIGEELDTIINEINGPSWDLSLNKISLNNLEKTTNQKESIDQLEIMKSQANSIKAVAMIRSTVNVDI